MPPPLPQQKVTTEKTSQSPSIALIIIFSVLAVLLLVIIVFMYLRYRASKKFIKFKQQRISKRVTKTWNKPRLTTPPTTTIREFGSVRTHPGVARPVTAFAMDTHPIIPERFQFPRKTMSFAQPINVDSLGIPRNPSISSESTVIDERKSHVFERDSFGSDTDYEAYLQQIRDNYLSTDSEKSFDISAPPRKASFKVPVEHWEDAVYV